jgi:hypothetical protein
LGDHRARTGAGTAEHQAEAGGVDRRVHRDLDVRRGQRAGEEAAGGAREHAAADAPPGGLSDLGVRGRRRPAEKKRAGAGREPQQRVVVFRQPQAGPQRRADGDSASGPRDRADAHAAAPSVLLQADAGSER